MKGALVVAAAATIFLASSSVFADGQEFRERWFDEEVRFAHARELYDRGRKFDAFFIIDEWIDSRYVEVCGKPWWTEQTEQQFRERFARQFGDLPAPPGKGWRDRAVKLGRQGKNEEAACVAIETYLQDPLGHSRHRETPGANLSQTIREILKDAGRPYFSGVKGRERFWELLENENPIVRQMALIPIATWSDMDATRRALALLDDDVEMVRAHAGMVLTCLRENSVAFTSLLHSKNPFVRSHALSALMASPYARDKVTGEIVKALSDPNPYVRLFAYLDSGQFCRNTEGIQRIRGSFWLREEDPLLLQHLPVYLLAEKR